MTVIYSFKTVLKSDRFPFINYGHHRVTSAASIEHNPYMGKHAYDILVLISADPESVVRGSNFDYVFLVDEGRSDPNTTISGSPSARHRNAI